MTNIYMTNFNYLIKKISKIVLGVMLFLCVFAVLNFNVYAKTHYVTSASEITVYGGDVLVPSFASGGSNYQSSYTTFSGWSKTSGNITADGNKFIVPDSKVNSTAQITVTFKEYSRSGSLLSTTTKDLKVIIKPNVTSIELGVGEVFNSYDTWYALGMRSNSNDKISSSNSSVATMTNDYGKMPITAHKTGKTTITSVSTSGINFKIEVVVNANKTDNSTDKCSNYSKSAQSTKPSTSACEAAVESGFKCSANISESKQTAYGDIFYSYSLTCQKSSDCATDYEKSGNFCIKKSSGNSGNSYTIKVYSYDGSSLKNDLGLASSTSGIYTDKEKKASFSYEKHGSYYVATATGSGLILKFSGINATRSGYTFDGIYTQKDCKGDKVNNLALSSSTATAYYACWKANSSNKYKVTFDGNGGTTSAGKSSLSFECENGTCPSFSSVSGFGRSGYTFKGWSTDKNCPSSAIVSRVSTVTKATTYYACWTNASSQTTLKQYTVSFSQSWGTGLICESGYSTPVSGLCSKYVNAGASITLPSSSSYNGYNNNYKFLGWTSSPLVKVNGQDSTVCTSSTIKQAGSKYSVNSNVSFYACYREDINGIRYAKDSASADGQTIDCGTALNITECVVGSDNVKYCFYNEKNGKSANGKVYRDKLAIAETIGYCKSDDSSQTIDEKIEKVDKYMYGTITAIIDEPFECGAKLYITTCKDNICNFTSIKNPDGSEIIVNGTANKDYLHTSQSKALKDTTNCPKVDVEIEEETGENVLVNTKCSSDSNITKLNVKAPVTLKMCYKTVFEDQDVKDMITKNGLVQCGLGYTLDETSIRANGDALCNDKICERNYTVSCNKKSDTASGISVITTPAIAGSDGYGYVKVQTYTKNSTIVGYYLSPYYEAPTKKSEWTSISKTTFNIKSTPGIQYIWLKDSDGNISNVASVAVIDTETKDTTLKQLQLKTSNNETVVPNGVSYVHSGNGYALLSNSISNKALVSQGFDSFTHEYKIDVDSPTLSVYATLTSTDASYVEGFGPRTVNLKYGVNTILIKIMNKEGKIRTYTVIATRKDDRSADNTLNDIKLSVGKIDFNANVTEYKITIPSNTKEVNVSSVINSELSSYVSGYEPDNVIITGDTTVKLIKVKSQTGSTRTYVLTFIKEKTDEIIDESLQLSGLTIPGIYIPFESKIANYNLSVDYTTDIIDIYTPLKDANSIVFTRIKKTSDSDYLAVSNKGINLDVGVNYLEIKVVNSKGEEAYYRLTILRKEFGLDVSNDTSLKDLKVLGYNIKFDPKNKEYTVKIKSEKSLVITAVPNSNRAEVFIRGNNELTGFSTVRIKVVAENGEYETYSIDIKKDAFNKTIEIAAIVVGCVIILASSYIIIKKKKNKNRKDYYRN